MTGTKKSHGNARREISLLALTQIEMLRHGVLIALSLATMQLQAKKFTCGKLLQVKAGYCGLLQEIFLKEIYFPKISGSHQIFQSVVPQCSANTKCATRTFYQTNPFVKSQNTNEINRKDSFW